MTWALHLSFLVAKNAWFSRSRSSAKDGCLPMLISASFLIWLLIALRICIITLCYHYQKRDRVWLLCAISGRQQSYPQKWACHAINFRILTVLLADDYYYRQLHLVNATTASMYTKHICFPEKHVNAGRSWESDDTSLKAYDNVPESCHNTVAQEEQMNIRAW